MCIPLAEALETGHLEFTSQSQNFSLYGIQPVSLSVKWEGGQLQELNQVPYIKSLGDPWHTVGPQ